jgi:hypothetical protein
MTVSLTWADIILTLLLGVFGSLLAALIYSRAPRWFDAWLTAWAARSKKSAQKRAKWITAQLDQIERFQKNPSELIADIGARIGSMISAAMLVVMTVSITGLSLLFSLLIPMRRALDLSYTAPDKAGVLKILAFVATGILLPCVFQVAWHKYTLAINRDLEKRKAQLQQQLALLKKRYGHLEQ